MKKFLFLLLWAPLTWGCDPAVVNFPEMLSSSVDGFASVVKGRFVPRLIHNGIYADDFKVEQSFGKKDIVPGTYTVAGSFYCFDSEELIDATHEKNDSPKIWQGERYLVISDVRGKSMLVTFIGAEHGLRVEDGMVISDQNGMNNKGDFNGAWQINQGAFEKQLLKGIPIKAWQPVKKGKRK